MCSSTLTETPPFKGSWVELQRKRQALVEQSRRAQARELALGFESIADGDGLLPLYAAARSGSSSLLTLLLARAVGLMRLTLTQPI